MISLSHKNSTPNRGNHIHFPVDWVLLRDIARALMKANGAHERIIGERKVRNEDKILSLYDDSINVIVRGKADAEVEFGNKLWLGEIFGASMVCEDLLHVPPEKCA